MVGRKGSSSAAPTSAKDEVALKKSSKTGDKSSKKTTATAEKTTSSKKDETNRKVRIKDDLKNDSSKSKTSSSKEKKGKAKSTNDSVDQAVVPSLSANGATGTEQVAPTEIINESGTKHSPKHRDGKKQPAKSSIKKNKKRKAAEADSDIEENDETVGEESGLLAETSTAAARSNGRAGADKDEDGEEEEEGEIDFLAGFQSGSDDEEGDGEGADSSDEEEENIAPITAKDLPPAGKAKQGKQVSKSKGKKDAPGVIYLGRIPHGFYEDEMRSYFEQFGEVTRLRLSRNRETGASKHYAFIEFLHSSVADIVAETMNNYLLSGHILQCKVIPQDEVHPKMWIGANRKFRPVPKGRIERLLHNAPKTDEQKQSIARRLVKREEAKRKRLSALGIEYVFEGYAKKELPTTEEVKAIETAKKLETEVKKDGVTAGKKASKSSAPSKPNKKARKST